MGCQTQAPAWLGHVTIDDPLVFALSYLGRCWRLVQLFADELTVQDRAELCADVALLMQLQRNAVQSLVVAVEGLRLAPHHSSCLQSLDWALATLTEGLCNWEEATAAADANAII